MALSETPFRVTPIKGSRITLIKQFPRGSVGAEIGVEHGTLSGRFLKLVRPRVLYLVDAWKVYPDLPYTQEIHNSMLRRALKHVRPAVAAGVVRFLLGDSVHTARLIPDDTLDWVYIDADHSYEHCLADIEAWYPKVKRAGFVAGHDHHDTYPGVSRAVRSFLSRRGIYKYGVTTQPDGGEASWMFRKEAESKST